MASRRRSAGQIRRLVGINLILGLLVVALASARPCSDSPLSAGRKARLDQYSAN